MNGKRKVLVAAFALLSVGLFAVTKGVMAAEEPAAAKPAAEKPAAEESAAEESATDDSAGFALSEPDSEIEIGLGYISEDNFHYGQYRGLGDEGAYGLVNLNIAKRDDSSGTWLTVDGRNLGLDSRSLNFEQERQGNWGYFLDYAELPRANPFMHETGLEGIGNPDLTINGVPLRDTQLELERQRLTVGGRKWFGDGFSVELTARDESKDGARQFGRGTGGAMEFLADPIDQHIRQMEARLNYAGQKLQLSGGYYGTDFDNKNTALDITGGNSSLASYSPIALPPDNQSQQVFVEGNYRFTPTFTSNFKGAYSEITQDDTFIVASAPGNTNLGGKVETTLLQLGLTARPLPKLTLLANFRYDSREDRTPVHDYFVITTGSTATGENEPRSVRTGFGKLEASYYLPAGFRITAGYDDEHKSRNTSDIRVVSFREETDEQTYRLALRRSISDTITGELTYAHSDRDGSNFLTNTVVGGALGSNLIAPLHLADRVRDKTRLLLTWTPTEPLSVQFAANIAEDDYEGSRTDLDIGVRKGEQEFYSLDANYQFSEIWQASLWLSTSSNDLDQATCVNASSVGVCFNSTSSPTWESQLGSDEEAGGFSLQGKFGENFSLGADVQYSHIQDKFEQSAITPNAVIAVIPDIETRITTATLFGKYDLNARSTIRVDLAYDLYRTDDWTWSTFTYIDGTHAFNDPHDDAYFVGVSYAYRWQ
jgi:MtrB/PioB family decaheme-associated outer membrane protein